MTAGRPYVTRLSAPYALIILSRGTNIDILSLNIRTLQNCHPPLGIIRLLATRDEAPGKVLGGDDGDGSFQIHGAAVKDDCACFLSAAGR